MSDVITKSLGPTQSAGTVGKMLTSEAAATGGIHDGLMPHPAKSAAKSAPFEVRVENRTTDALAGSTWTFRTPTVDTIVDSFLVIDTNAPTLGPVSHFGLNVIDSIIVRSCGTVQEIPYRSVMRYVLANSSTEERALLLQGGGVSNLSAQTIIVPLPLFWTPYGQGKIRRNHPGLPAFLLSAPVEVEIRMAPTAELGGSFIAEPYSRVNLVHLIRSQDACAMSDARAAGSWHHWGYEYREVPKIPLAAGASTTLDFKSFKGNSAGVALFPVLTGDVTNYKYYDIAQSLSDIETRIDGSRYLPINTNMSTIDTSLVLSYLSHHWGMHGGTDTTDSKTSHYATFIPFGGSLVPGGDGESYNGTGAVYEGSLNLRAVQSLEMDVTNKNGADITIYPLNVMYAKYSVVDGLVKSEV